MATSKRLMLCSGYSDGFYVMEYDESVGTVTQRDQEALSAERANNLAYTVFDERSRSLYAIKELVEPPELSRWKVDEDCRAVVKVQTVPLTGGSGPCHVAISQQHNLVFVANYGNGSFVAYPIADPATGALSESPVYEETYPGGSGVDPDRQEASHAHGTFVYGDNAYVVDLGGDKIWHYRLSASSGVEKASSTSVGPGNGPRHLAVDERRGRLYIGNELINSVSVYDVSPTTGELTLAGPDVPYTVEGAADGVRQYAAGISVGNGGRTLYLGNRGDGAMMVFGLSDSAPFVAQVQTAKTNGTWPRYFGLTEKHVFPADERGNIVDVYEIDAANQGRLSLVSEGSKCGEAPSCLTFV